MSNAKLTKWSQFLKSNFVQLICVFLLSAFILKAIEKYGGMSQMKSLFQTFFIELWPIWIGIGGGLIYFLIREFISMHKGAIRILKFDEKLDEIATERRELLTHVHNSYNGLAVKHDKIEKRLPPIST